MTRGQRERGSALVAQHPAPSPATVRVRARATGRGFAAVVWAVAVLLGGAILKPWGPGSPDSTAPPRLPAPTTAPTTAAASAVPTADSTADGLALPICLGAGGWRIASLERWRSHAVRVWSAIEPIETAAGPLDPAIPSVPIVALELTALGCCAPAYGPLRPAGPATVTAWTVDDDLAIELRLRQVEPPEGSTPIAALYTPLAPCPEPPGCGSLLPEPVLGAWATGRVVFRYWDAGTGRAAWLAADIEISESPLPSPSGY